MLSTVMDPKDRRTRLDAMKTAAKAFIEARSNDRIAILTFAAFPELRCPPTLDHDAAIAILEDVESVLPRSQEDRTGIGLGLARAARIVRDSTARAKVVVLLTDGQENVFEITPADAAKLAKDFGVRVYTIGAGRGDRSFLGIQPMDFSELEKIAEGTGGKFFRAEDKNALTDTYAAIDQLEKTALQDPRYRSEEMFHWVLAPGLAAIALAFLLRSLVFPEVP
jgi:Ca-activated chloride channel homolog